MNKANFSFVLETPAAGHCLRAALKSQRIAGAISLPYRAMNPETTAHLPKDKIMVTYCWGPGCNASTKGALKLAALGFRVKELIGCLEYWIKEGGPVDGKLGS